MSQNQGRSWRPEKKVDRRATRKLQIAFVFAVLTSLIAAVAVLLLRPAVPVVHLVAVASQNEAPDEAGLTLPSFSSARSDVLRVMDWARRFKEANATQIGLTEKFDSIDEFLSSPQLPNEDGLLIYCVSDAWCVPDREAPDQSVLELLPVRNNQQPVRFSEFLKKVASASAAPRVLLLELTGRLPGLGSGALAADMPSLVRSEIRKSAASGLTVICAWENSERSWPYRPEAAAAVADAKAAAGNGPDLPFGALKGTAFSHFVVEALEKGQFRTPEELYTYLRDSVKTWVKDHAGETQTVWIESIGEQTRTQELLARVTLPKPAPAVNEKKSESSAAKTDGGAVAETAGKDGSKESAAALTPENPAAPLLVLKERRQKLSDATSAAVLQPGDWLRLNASIQAAEIMAINGNTPELNRLIDLLKKMLNDMEEQTRAGGASPTVTAIANWILTPVPAVLTEEQSRLVRRTASSFDTEPGKAPSELPDEFQENSLLRQELVRQILTDLIQFADAVDSFDGAERDLQITRRIRRLQNVLQKWPQEVVPEPALEMVEVLSAVPPQQLPPLLKSIARLLNLRIQAMTLASGRDLDGRPLRKTLWKRLVSTSESGLSSVLQTLHAAERWLCLGPDALLLADDQLAKATTLLEALKQQTELSRRLSRVQDEQKFEILAMIQYLAMRLEQTSLPEQELQQAIRMAEKLSGGSPAAEDFPDGPLEPAGFSRNHIQAMFSLTRDFQAREADVSDETALTLLRQYVRDHRSGSLSAREALDLIPLPDIPRRDALIADILQNSATGQETPDPTSHSGIWLSFFSLRLVDALSHQTSTDHWGLWSKFVESLKAGNEDAIRNQRARLASALKDRWTAVAGDFRKIVPSDIFVSERDVVQLLEQEISRRSRTTAANHLSLLVGIQQALELPSEPVSGSALSILNPDQELSVDYRGQTRIRAPGASTLYVLNSGIEVHNTGVTQDRNWHRVPLGAVTNAESVLDLQVTNEPPGIVPVRIVATDALGVALSSAMVNLQPPADAAWEVEAWLVKEGMPDTGITLDILNSSSERRLRLLPTTWDPEAKAHQPSRFRLRLKRVRGVCRKVRIRALHAGTDVVAWSWPEPLTIPEGSSVTEIPLLAPMVPPAAGSPPAAAVPAVVDISNGITFEMTPDDLSRKITTKITTQFTIRPRLMEPDQILERPVPHFDEATATLEIPLKKRPPNVGMVYPEKLPAQVEFSPALSLFLQQGTNLRSLNADGEVFRIPLDAGIRKALGTPGLEFGVSIAGIPHGWWWRLNERTEPTLLDGKADVRVFLNVENEMDAPPLTKFPELLLGAGWQKAKFHARAFLHGDQFEDAWELGLLFRREETGAIIRLKDPSFQIRTRYAETVRIQPGENGLWLFSSEISPWTVPVFEPSRYQLQNGTYSLEAILQKRPAADNPPESRVLLTLDDSPPVLTESGIQLPDSISVNSPSLKGRIRVTDPESDVRTVRIWLNPENPVTQVLPPGPVVEGAISLNRTAGFPKLDQKEIDNEQPMTLSVEAENGAGLKTLVKKQVVFVLRGKPAPMVEEPGMITVLFEKKQKYNVTVTGDKFSDKKIDVMGSVTFPVVPPGKYKVTWKPVQGSTGNGEAEVILKSKEAKTVGPGA